MEGDFIGFILKHYSIIFYLIFGIIGTILNLVLRHLTSAIDYIFSRMIVVVTSKFACKKLYDTSCCLVEHATSDENKSQTIDKISKLLCFFPDLVDNCRFQHALQKVGPNVMYLPQYLLADKQAVMDKASDNLVLFIDYLDAGAECPRHRHSR